PRAVPHDIVLFCLQRTPDSAHKTAGGLVGIASATPADGSAHISSTGRVRFPRIPPREVSDHGASQVSFGGAGGVRAPNSEFGIQYGQVSGRMNRLVAEIDHSLELSPCCERGLPETSLARLVAGFVERLCVRQGRAARRGSLGERRDTVQRISAGDLRRQLAANRTSEEA